MYSEHCHIILEGGGGTLRNNKLRHLPVEDTTIKIKPLSTGIETEYKVEKVTMLMEEITLTYPGPPVDSDNDWIYSWEIEVSVVV